jgi:hypothetical protein
VHDLTLLSKQVLHALELGFFWQLAQLAFTQLTQRCSHTLELLFLQPFVHWATFSYDKSII